MTTPRPLSGFPPGLIESWPAGAKGYLVSESKRRPLGKVVTKADVPQLARYKVEKADVPQLARYKVEHCDTADKWVKTHRGLLKTYSAALDQCDGGSSSRIMVDHAGKGVWEEVELRKPKIDNSCPECEGSGEGVLGAVCRQCDGVGVIPWAQVESA